MNIIHDYNAAAKIGQVIASGRTQIFSAWDRLIVDAASTAHTGRITATTEVAELALGG